MPEPSQYDPYDQSQYDPYEGGLPPGRLQSPGPEFAPAFLREETLGRGGDVQYPHNPAPAAQHAPLRHTDAHRRLTSGTPLRRATVLSRHSKSLPGTPRCKD
ncbi:hypothetical protein Strvi_0452 [Streptomyces violaceusniger Tu 4113]|uniref:Uncharacterized protein n=1 Tax=Streptomyces violaceusniger (strain Tu 4113) TaxID=653045 RepID=G2NZZ6_STRV4|nr:hypothetical protein Strvi_0452 [Streptomyces violaceusniger Tu 4113]